MRIDNTIKTAKTKMFFIISFIVFLSSLIYVLIAGIKENYLFLIITIVSFFIYIILHILKLHFFFFSDKGNKLTIRFYNAHPLIRKYKTYEIIKRNFAGFEVKKSFFNYRQEIIFKIKTKKGVAKYPPVSISALTNREKKVLIKFLTNYSN